MAQEAQAHARPQFQQQTHQSRQRAALQLCMPTPALLQTDQSFYGQCGRVVRPTLKVAEVRGLCPCETPLLE